jgi:hypothetical protein
VKPQEHDDIVSQVAVALFTEYRLSDLENLGQNKEKNQIKM